MAETKRALKVSRRGIYYDLSISPYVFDNGVYQFVFSSKYNYGRFREYKQYSPPQSAMHVSSKEIPIITIDNSAILDIKEYIRIEKRGFMVYSYKFDRWYNEVDEMKFAVLEV